MGAIGDAYDNAMAESSWLSTRILRQILFEIVVAEAGNRADALIVTSLLVSIGRLPDLYADPRLTKRGVAEGQRAWASSSRTIFRTCSAVIGFSAVPMCCASASLMSV